ncbi:FecR family protein [Sphingomonas morindae]|nr:FecR domain-containing protein [Sphingomonas morindae]
MRDAPHAATARACAAWRASSPAHAEAFARAQAAREAAQQCAPAPALLALRHEAVARAALARPPRRRLALAAGALLLAGGPLAAWTIERIARPPEPPAFTRSVRTGIGERAAVTLPDGSRITLDTASRLSVRYQGGRRSVALDGQGWFEVRPGAEPLIVSAGGRTLSVDPGAFDIRTDPAGLRALAVDGGLTIDGTRIGTGQMLLTRADEAIVARPRNLVPLTGWRQGLLQFEDVPLAEAVAEFNRYRHRPIRLADPAAARLRLSGSFRTAEGPAFVDALVAGFPVRVKQDSPDAIVLASR